MLRRCVELLTRGLRARVHDLNQSYKQSTKPGTASLVTGMVVDVTRRKRDLLAENAFLRQRMIVPAPDPRPSLRTRIAACWWRWQAGSVDDRCVDRGRQTCSRSGIVKDFVSTGDGNRRTHRTPESRRKPSP